MAAVGKEEKEGYDSLISMPGEAVRSLRLELSNLLGEKLASGVLFRFGYRCGETLVDRTKSKITEKEGISQVLPSIWDKTGLGSITNIQEISEEEMMIEQKESMEAHAMGVTNEPSCDYTRGYLAGIVSVLTKKKHYSVETECISEQKKKCKFQLVVFPHKVYVPKKKTKTS
jgi:predicted hydrocarbon binding protein